MNKLRFGNTLDLYELKMVWFCVKKLEKLLSYTSHSNRHIDMIKKIVEDLKEIYFSNFESNK